ncbi:MAG: (2Fe-2S)-binding protein [Chloroflexota bacterium]
MSIGRLYRGRGARTCRDGKQASPATWHSRDAMKRILCLCHDVSDDDITRAVRAGFDHPETVKRSTGATMGPCQGRTCAELVLVAIARETGVARASLRLPTSRPPAFAIPMGLLAASADDPEASG